MFGCVSGTYVIRLCVGNDAISLILAVGYVILVFVKTVKKQERSMIRIKMVPFVLMHINVFGVCVSLLLVCIENERVEIFCENVWRNSIAINKENQLESIFYQ